MTAESPDFIADAIGKVEEILARSDAWQGRMLEDCAGNLELALSDVEQRARLGLGPDQVGSRSGHAHSVYERALRLEAALRPRGPRTLGGLLLATGLRHPHAARVMEQYRAHFETLAADRPVVQNIPLSFILALVVARLAPAPTGLSRIA